MRKWHWKARYYALSLAAGGLFVLQGCALSDQQLASIWSSVLTAALNTVVSTAITTAAG